MERTGDKRIEIREIEDFFDGFAHFLFDFGFQFVDFFEAVGGMLGGAVADDDVDEATFEREDFVVAIEIAERGEVFVEGVFVVFDVVLKELVGGAEAGNHFIFAAGEGVGEADAAEFVGVAVILEVAVAGDRVVEEGAEAFSDIVEVAEGAGVIGVGEIGGLMIGDLVLADGGGESAGAVANEDGVVNPSVMMAIFGGFATERFEEGESFLAGEGFLVDLGCCARSFMDVFDGFHGFIVAKMLDFRKFVV